MASKRSRVTVFLPRKCRFIGLQVRSTPFVWHLVTGSTKLLKKKIPREIKLLLVMGWYYLCTTTTVTKKWTHSMDASGVERGKLIPHRDAEEHSIHITVIGLSSIFISSNNRFGEGMHWNSRFCFWLGCMIQVHFYAFLNQCCFEGVRKVHSVSLILKNSAIVI